MAISYDKLWLETAVLIKVKENRKEIVYFSGLLNVFWRCLFIISKPLAGDWLIVLVVPPPSQALAIVVTLQGW